MKFSCAEVGSISDSHSARIIDLLLQRARSGKLGFDHRLYLGGLNHQTISQQLTRALLDPKSTDTELALAVGIAEECKVQELSATLFKLLSSEQTRPFLLARIADALIAIHKAEPNMLLALLRPEILSRDIDFRVRGKALDVLVPNTLSVTDALTYVDVPVAGAVNDYSMFLDFKLPRFISRELLPTFFQFLNSKDLWATSGSPFRSLGEKVLAAALHHLDDNQIAELTAAEWVRVVSETYNWSLRGAQQISDVLTSSPEIRHQFATALINLLSRREDWDPNSASFLWFEPFPILEQEDLSWSLGLLDSSSGKQLRSLRFYLCGWVSAVRVEILPGSFRSNNGGIQ